jgi:hypothetical protein
MRLAEVCGFTLHVATMVSLCILWSGTWEEDRWLLLICLTCLAVWR